MDLGEVPGGEADLQHGEVLVAVWYFEAAAFDDGSAVAAAQGPSFGAGEGQPQRGGIRTASCHGGAGEEAGERRVIDLAVALAVVVLLDPRLRRLVEPGQGEVVDALEHGHQPALDRCPKNLLLAVLVGGVRECRLMKDTEPGETFADLGGRHRTAVVAHRGARQAALLHRLRQTVRNGLGRFHQIPLQMAGQPRAVVEHPEQDRGAPFTARCQHLARTVVAIPMPQSVDILGLEATHLARLEPHRRCQRALGPARRRGTAPGQAMRGHEPPDRRVGGHRAQFRPRLGQGDQIVVMQLDTPAFVSPVLLQQRPAQRRRHRCLRTGIAAPLATQHADRIMALVAGAVEPALQRGDAKADRRAGARVAPFARRQLPQSRVQRALRRRRGQQLADHREAQPRPALMHPRSVSLRHLTPPEK